MYKKLLLLVYIISISYSTNLLARTFEFVTLISPPAEYKEYGKAKGINVEIVQEVFKRMGHNIKIKFYPWKRALSMAKNGKVDGIIDAAYSKSRANALYYPKTQIYKEQWYAFKRKNSNITIDEDFSNINKIKLGISRGFVYGGKIQRLIDEKKFKSIEKVHNNELNINKLIVGRFDIFLGVKSTIFFLSKNLGLKDKIEIVKQTNTNNDFLLSSSNTYLAFSKKRVNQSLVTHFSEILKLMIEDGTIDYINKKYY